MEKLLKFLKEEEGATTVEYGVMVGIIAVGIIAVVTLVRDALRVTFNNVATAIPAP